MSIPEIPEKLFFRIGEVCDIAGVEAYAARIGEAYTIVDKLARRDTLAALRKEIGEALCPAENAQFKPEAVRIALTARRAASLAPSMVATSVWVRT